MKKTLVTTLIVAAMGVAGTAFADSSASYTLQEQGTASTTGGTIGFGTWVYNAGGVMATSGSGSVSVGGTEAMQQNNANSSGGGVGTNLTGAGSAAVLSGTSSSASQTQTGVYVSSTSAVGVAADCGLTGTLAPFANGFANAGSPNATGVATSNAQATWSN